MPHSKTDLDKPQQREIYALLEVYRYECACFIKCIKYIISVLLVLKLEFLLLTCDLQDLKRFIKCKKKNIKQ